jgi:hypothetical protein
MLRGYDIFFTEPGAAQEMFCSICHSRCEVRRNVSGPTDFGSAMAKKNKPHDVFTCPHTNEEWHEQAQRLVLAIEEMPSKTVAGLMQKDLEELLAEQNLA